MWAQDSQHSKGVLKCEDHGVDKKEENIGLRLETMETIGGILVNFPAKSGEGKINKDKAHCRSWPKLAHLFQHTTTGTLGQAINHTESITCHQIPSGKLT